MARDDMARALAVAEDAHVGRATGNGRRSGVLPRSRELRVIDCFAAIERVIDKDQELRSMPRLIAPPDSAAARDCPLTAAAHPHFRVMATSPGTPPGKSTISTLSLYPRGRKYFAQS